MKTLAAWTAAIAAAITAATAPALATMPAARPHVLGLGVESFSQWTGSAPACERVPPPSHC